MSHRTMKARSDPFDSRTVPKQATRIRQIVISAMVNHNQRLMKTMRKMSMWHRSNDTRLYSTMHSDPIRLCANYFRLYRIRQRPYRHHSPMKHCGHLKRPSAVNCPHRPYRMTPKPTPFEGPLSGMHCADH